MTPSRHLSQQIDDTPLYTTDMIVNQVTVYYLHQPSTAGRSLQKDAINRPYLWFNQQHTLCTEPYSTPKSVRQ